MDLEEESDGRHVPSSGPESRSKSGTSSSSSYRSRSSSKSRSRPKSGFKIPSLTPDKVIRVLERRGFVLDRIRGGHRIYCHPETRRRVVIPYHKKDLPKGTLMEILRQAGISREELKELL